MLHALRTRRSRFDYIIVQVFKAVPAVALLLSKPDGRVLLRSVCAGVACGAKRAACMQMKMKRIWAVASNLDGLAREPGRVLLPAAGQSLRS